MAKTAREVMSGGAECVGESDSVADAARKLDELNVGAMPICGEDNRLKGMLTDRDIVVKVIAQGRDPGSTTAREIADQEEVVRSDSSSRRSPRHRESVGRGGAVAALADVHGNLPPLRAVLVEAEVEVTGLLEAQRVSTAQMRSSSSRAPR